MHRTNRPFNRASNSVTASRSRRLIGATAEALEMRLVLSTFIVNTFLDQTDPPGSTTVSLRDAIAAAASHAGPDTIDVPAGTYPLTQGQLLIDDTGGTVTIDATGGTAVINAQSKSGVIEVAAKTTVSANGLTITGGGSDTAGGGIDNFGTLVLQNCTITGNTSVNGGCGIDNFGQMTVVDTTVTGNNEVYNNNNAAGGVFNESSGQMTIVDSTIVGNHGRYSAGGIENSGTLTLANSIVAGDTEHSGPTDVSRPSDVFGAFKSLGHNLIGQIDSSSSGWIASDLTGTDAHPLSPDLSPLGNYGGPTQTLVPLAGSPAIGAGSVALIPSGVTADQRGFARIVGGKVDIGAVELQDASVITVAPPAVQSVVAGVAASIKLGSFTDPGGKGPFGIDVDWGDGSPDSYYHTSAVGSLGSESHAFINIGALKGTIIVFDGSGDISNASFSVSSAAAPAQMFTVNTTGDQTDPAGSKTVSLRDAVSRADASFGPVTITFDPKVFAAAQTITLSSNLELSSDPAPITLDGPTAGVTAAGALVVIDAGITASLNRINAGIDNNGTLAVSDGVVSGVTTLYGGIENAGTMTLTDSVVSGNDAQEEAFYYLGGAGGGIDNTGKMTVVDSTITGNNADASGGGIDNTGQMTVVDSTITGNLAVNGGGIANAGQMAIVDSTITGNNTIAGSYGYQGPGGVASYGTLTLANTIVAGNSNGDVAGNGDVTGTVMSLGHNLIGDASESSGWISTDLTGTDANPLNPELAPLGNYGGPTQTQVPLAGSPAIGAGSVALISTGVATDQRGFARVVGGKVDIGAVEVQDVSVVTVTPPPAQSVVAGVPAPIKLGSFTDPGGKGPFTVYVEWGDGSADSFFPISAVGSLGSQTHAFARTGLLEAKIGVLDGSGDASQLGSFSVSAALSPTRTFTVNTTADQTDPEGRKTVSLRDAFNDADASVGPVTVTFDPKVFATAQTITLGSNLELGSNHFAPITVVGPTAGVTVAGATIVIEAGVTASLSRFTIANGQGGSSVYVVGIDNSGQMTVVDSTITGNSSSGNGAGIDNSGQMTVVDSTITGNSAGNNGGGIYNSGQMTVVDSTITGNTITGISAANNGGGIGNTGQMTVVDSTISGNSCYYGSGGGIENSGQMTISDSTVTENSTVGSVGGIDNNGALTLANSIVAGNTSSSGASDVSGVIKSLGHNLIGQIDSNSSGWISTDLTGTDANPLNPDLSPLGNYGGPTQTQVPLTGSPAIGAGSVALIPAGDTTDQRGFARVVGGKVDIGAVELQKASVVTVTPPAAQSAVALIPASIKLGAFTDSAGKGPFTVIVNWGDGSPDSLYTVSAAGSLGSQTHTFIETGSLKATIAVADSSGDVSQLASFSIASTGASITGTVFNDANGDGTQNRGETGLAGVGVYADLGNVGYFVASDPAATTNATGGYSLTGLLAGSYVIRQLSASGYTQTFPTKGSGEHVTVSAGQILSGQNFGDELPAATTGDITGTVFNDANGDGTEDDGETGLAGVLVYADLGNVGHIVAGDPSTLTNATGGYTLSGLAAGSYVIRQVLTTGYVQTTPGSGFGHHVILSLGQRVLGQNFGDKI